MRYGRPVMDGESQMMKSAIAVMVAVLWTASMAGIGSAQEMSGEDLLARKAALFDEIEQEVAWLIGETQDAYRCDGWAAEEADRVIRELERTAATRRGFSAQDRSRIAMWRVDLADTMTQIDCDSDARGMYRDVLRTYGGGAFWEVVDRATSGLRTLE